jgi:5-methylcytosine-specific restriction endonuclease McrA
MSDLVPSSLRELVRERANGRCEYCLLHEDDAMFPHEVDHIIAIKHRGPTIETNLAWACLVCNRFKGSDIASVDLETGRIVRLFNPRTDTWAEHFRLEGNRIAPLTAEGRVTEHLLQFNRPENLDLRQLLIQSERYPR